MKFLFQLYLFKMAQSQKHLQRKEEHFVERRFFLLAGSIQISNQIIEGFYEIILICKL
ncbi:hypothetical protein SAMN05444397_11928 [Flavobacterium aquidurense]|nr:hypothetical protein SAMN05444397_11928 [Flavobacterium aquidurense]